MLRESNKPAIPPAPNVQAIGIAVNIFRCGVATLVAEMLCAAWRKLRRRLCRRRKRVLVKSARSAAKPAISVRTRRAYFDCRFGQLHVRTAFPTSGGFDEGTTLVCIHDSFTSSRSFDRLSLRAAADRPVYAPDLPGCGESDAPPESASIADYAAALSDFAADLRLRQYDVLGIGAGSCVAAEIAIVQPNRVRRVALCGFPSAAQATAAASSGDPAAWLARAAKQYSPSGRLQLISQPNLLIPPSEDTAGLLHAEVDAFAARLGEFLK
jgi:pimeloyl-ACP methyl ester carboxylesterase